MEKLKVIFLDEYSMLRRKELFYMSERLKQIKVSELLFGGLCVVLVGDPAQLPPVQADSLWVDGLKPSTKQDDKNGNIIYNQFSDVVILKENNRLDSNDPESEDFNKILEKVRDGKLDEESRLKLITKCSMYKMGMLKFGLRGV